jgi:hypothetical protein
MEFTEDGRYQAIAEAYALDAVDFARDNMKVELDWSDQSIERLESILDVFRRDMAKAKPSDEQLQGFSKMWGSYLGEVYRRNHGGTWGLVSDDGNTFPGMRSASGALFWPWGRVEQSLGKAPRKFTWPWGRAEKRLQAARENNVWHYYLSLIDRP